MKPQSEHRESLKHLSSLMAKIHKILMDAEMAQLELIAGEPIKPGTKLQLLIGSPEFEWLRALSQLMALVDDAIYQKEPLTEEQTIGLKEEVDKLLIKQTNDIFTGKLQTTAKSFPEMKHLLEKVNESLQNGPT